MDLRNYILPGPAHAGGMAKAVLAKEFDQAVAIDPSVESQPEP